MTWMNLHISTPNDLYTTYIPNLPNLDTWFIHELPCRAVHIDTGFNQCVKNDEFWSKTMVFGCL